MAKALVINSNTKIIMNVLSDVDQGYDPPHGRELVKGSGKVGEVYKAPKPKAKPKEPEPEIETPVVKDEAPEEVTNSKT